MADIWQLILKTNTLNFIIVLLCLLFIFAKLNVNKKLDNIKEEIKSYVDESSEEKSKAEKELTQIKEKVQKLPQELKYIEMSAKNSVENLERKVESEIKEKMLDIDNNVKRIMNLETKKFKSKLSSKLSDASVNLAKENALKQLENNRELHNKYIYDAIDELDRINL